METRLRYPDEQSQRIAKLVYDKKYASKNDFIVKAITEKLERELLPDDFKKDND